MICVTFIHYYTFTQGRKVSIGKEKEAAGSKSGEPKKVGEDFFTNKFGALCMNVIV